MIIKKIIYVIIAIFCGLVFFVMASSAFSFPSNIQAIEETATVNTNHVVAFNVFYVENNLFEENPVPQTLDFLMSFTNYIQIQDYFNVSVDVPTAVNYDFEVIKRFKLTYPHAQRGELVVFKQEEILAYGSGRNESSSNNIIISPRDYINLYRDIREYHLQQIIREDVTGLGDRNLNASLYVEFSYVTHLPSINERVFSSRSINIPLSNEVYNLEVDGSDFTTNTFTIFAGSTSVATERWPLWVYVLGALGSLAVFGWAVAGLINGPNNDKREQIIGKYEDNIVMVYKPLNLSNYEILEVKDFKEMLKLSTWYNRPILFCAESGDNFVFIAEDFAFIYNVEDQELPPPDQTEPEYETEFIAWPKPVLQAKVKQQPTSRQPNDFEDVQSRRFNPRPQRKSLRQLKSLQPPKPAGSKLKRRPGFGSKIMSLFEPKPEYDFEEQEFVDWERERNEYRRRYEA